MSLIIEKDYSSIHRKSNPDPMSHKAIKQASSLKSRWNLQIWSVMFSKTQLREEGKISIYLYSEGPPSAFFQTTVMTLFRFSVISHSKRKTHREPFLFAHTAHLHIPLCTQQTQMDPRWETAFQIPVMKLPLSICRGSSFSKYHLSCEL